MVDFKIDIFDVEEYKKILEETQCFSTNKRNLFYNDNQKSIYFFKKLLKLTHNCCFYCGEKLNSNNIKGIYFEKEHIIDKKIFSEKEEEYRTLLHCKKNLIPICKNCNSIKSFREKKEIKSKIPNICNLEKKCMDVLELSKNHNFDILEPIFFDLLNLTFYTNSNSEKIKNLKLNNRVSNYFSALFELLYDVNINVSKEKRNQIFRSIVKNKVEEKFIDFIEEYQLLNTYKLKNLIETITLLNL